MVRKIPPPPMFANSPEWQPFNRWLLEVTSILSNEGGINPDQVDGLTALFAEVAVNTADILALDAGLANTDFDVAALQSDVIAILNAIATINGQITTLSARGEVLNGVGVPAGGLGKVNDWYANIGGGVGARIYVKTAVATWTAFPF